MSSKPWNPTGWRHWADPTNELDRLAIHVTSPQTLATSYNSVMHASHDFSRITLSFIGLFWLWVINSAPLAGELPPDPTPVQFERDVRPLLRAHCMSCHGLEKRAGDLDLRTLPLILNGGTQGPAIVPGSAARSILYRKVASRSMPPEGELPLTNTQLTTLRRWLDSAEPPANAEPSANTHIDAADRSHWAFQPLLRTPPPSPGNGTAARTVVDHFLIHRLREVQLSYSPQAERGALVRRLALDLTGLPPTPATVRNFLRDRSPCAYDNLVDHFLASPHFGQKWGRHWLDASGYVDTIGDDTDATIAKVATGKWRYREYVIDAHNHDMPFDRFVQEQVAGDEMSNWREAEQLTPDMLRQLIATTFLRSAADETLQTELNTADIRHEVLARTMEVTIHNLLGLTLQCARCHDHKYDPLPQRDYYRLLACFTPAFDPQAWLQPAERELPDISPKERNRRVAHNDGKKIEIAAVQQQIAAIRTPHLDRITITKLNKLPASIRGDVQKATRTPADKRDVIQKYLAMKLGPAVAVSEAEITATLTAKERVSVAQLRTDVGTLQSQLKTWGIIQSVYDTHTTPATYLLSRGDHLQPRNPVEPGMLQVLTSTQEVNQPLPIATAPATSGRRTSLANWLTETDSPASGLLARVVVNRAWQHLFGRGIVETSDNFGIMGSTPDHPDLLDYLAADFRNQGWHYKRLLQQLVSTAAYRQSSAPPAPPADADPDNRLLWRMPLRQLDSEVLRDSVLALSGQLDRSFGGPPVATTPQADGYVRIDQGQLHRPADAYRRSLYLLQRRRYHESFLEAFGQPELTRNCTQRSATAVVSQSLTLINDHFMFEQSMALAERLQRETRNQPLDRQIAVAFQMILSRDADDQEQQWSLDFVKGHSQRYENQPDLQAPPLTYGLRHLCHMLLCTNEFLYTP
ncbi:MAG: hypothetical protein CMJ75_10330 [Planctomycetaceae bacterium]|nr:hypothetical protein [Planctomycetaceae bacterium]